MNPRPNNDPFFKAYITNKPVINNNFANPNFKPNTNPQNDPNSVSPSRLFDVVVSDDDVVSPNRKDMSAHNQSIQ